jgi:hypothetical protein
MVIKKSTGEALLALIMKQIKNAGVPIWGELHSLDLHCIHAYIFCTDAGGDIARSRRLLKASITTLSPFLFFFDIDCLQHQNSLAVQSLMALADRMLSRLLCMCTKVKPFRYVATLIKSMNVWREHAAQIFYVWKERHPSTAHHAKNMPPKMIPSRWGTKDTCEAKMLSLPQEHFKEVMHIALAKQTRHAARSAMANPDSLAGSLEFCISVEEAQLYDKASYAEKFSRWCCDAITGFEEPAWWITMHVSYRIGEPWAALREHLQKHNSLVRKTGVGALAHLVFNPEQFYNDIVKLTAIETWQDFLDEVLAKYLSQVSACIMETALMSAAEYRTRIFSRVTSFPARLLIFAKQAHNHFCEERRLLATEILSHNNDDLLEMNALKLKQIARPMLEECAASACLPLKAWKWFRDIVQLWQGDTQEMEGLNNKIKLEVKSAPHISLECLSARIINKEGIDAMISSQKVDRHQRLKWSWIADGFDRLRAKAVNHFEHINDVLAVTDRFQAPDPLPIADAVAALAVSMHGVGRALDEAQKERIAQLNVRWYREWCQASKDKATALPSCTVFGVASDAETGWRCVKTQGYCGHLVKCHVDDRKRAEVMIPYQWSTSLDFIKEHCLHVEECTLWKMVAKDIADASGHLCHETQCEWFTLRYVPPRRKARAAAAGAALEAGEATEAAAGDPADIEVPVPIADVFEFADERLVGIDYDQLDIDTVEAEPAPELPAKPEEMAGLLAVTVTAPGPDEIDASIHAWLHESSISLLALEKRSASMDRPLADKGEIALLQYREGRMDMFLLECHNQSLIL